jgi:hypothetical protein
MKLSEDRISHIAHKIWDALYDEDLVDYTDDDKALKGIKLAMAGYLRTDDEIDDAARQKIASLKRGVSEGSREWDILYQKYYEEEAKRRNF